MWPTSAKHPLNKEGLKITIQEMKTNSRTNSGDQKHVDNGFICNWFSEFLHQKEYLHVYTRDTEMLHKQQRNDTNL